VFNFLEEVGADLNVSILGPPTLAVNWHNIDASGSDQLFY
jgi:hypothetical protein